MAVIEYIQENPDCSISISNELSRLLWNGVIVRTGEKNKMILYRVNNLPFGYSNPLSVIFNQLLKQARQSDGK